LNEGNFDRFAWEKLIADFKAAGRLSGADALEQKMNHYCEVWDATIQL
jgi:hypothetical protein